jgi:1,2-diacylglycerol-3-alpha-glucose alpha-1,2-glucosyltransferase
VLNTYPDVPPRALVHITAVTGRAGEPLREREAVALGEPSGESNVLPRAVRLTGGDGLLGQVGQPLDALGGDIGTHPFSRTEAGAAVIACGRRRRGTAVRKLHQSVQQTTTKTVRVLNYLELEDRIRGGIVTATRQQRSALDSAGVDVVTTPWVGDGPLAAARSRLSGGRAFREYDIAHCNVIGPGSVAVARHAGRDDIPLVLHSHVTAEDFGESFRFASHVAPALKPYLRWFYSQADLVLCPSEYTKSVVASYPVTAPIEPMTNGVDIDSLHGHEQFRADVRDRYDLDGMVVFCVGEVFERKGLTTFCRVAQQTDYEFAWFGHYEEGLAASEPVRRWTSSPPENVTFAGWMDDKRMAFGAGDVYLFATKDENQGIAALEAMATGNAVVLRDIPVFEEFFTHGEDCLKCETEAEFVDALDHLAEHPELRDRLGENARETAAAHSLDRVGDRLVETYEELLAEARSATP